MARRKFLRLKKHDLTAWFLEDHATLPAAYVKSCEEFFKSIKPQATSIKPQAASNKPVDKLINKG
jgi:hypothetical protein